MSGLHIEIADTPTPEDIAILGRGIGAFNDAFAPSMKRAPFAVFLRNAAGEALGGIEAFYYWRTAYVNRVWVNEAVRGKGHGRDLMRAFEDAAIQRGVAMIWLETMDWQARGFYEKLGFTAFGELEHPVPDAAGAARRSFFLKKQI
jgi:ribosomal protein S18 acetylase RimI-like enzyme